MTILIGRDGAPCDDIAMELSEARRLADDLARIAGGGQPGDRDLREAPLLTGWRLATRPVECLVGQVGAHARLPGPVVRTECLLVLAPEQGWARTASRLYRISPVHRPAGGHPPFAAFR
jgi:hypothetical protein